MTAGFIPFLVEHAPDQHFYGFPEFDARGVKVAEHGGLAQDGPHPDQVDRSIHRHDAEAIVALTARFLPHLEGPMASEVCFYPMSLDGHFLVGPLDHERVIACVGLSGHGFKFAPALGEAVTASVLGASAPADVAFLAPARLRR
jgi:sarcosine oxidase/N-methyl-L-tryptophan oxidase